MKPTTMMFALLAGVFLCPADAAAQQTEATGESQTILFPTGTHDPREIAEVVQRIFSKEMEVLPLIRHSAVAIRVSAEKRDEAMSFLQSLTPPAQLMRIRLTLLRADQPLSAEEMGRLSGPISQVTRAVQELRKAGRVEIFNDAELTVMQDLKSMIQVGDRVAVATGSMRTQGGRVAENFQTVEVGTIVSLMGKPDGDNLILDLDYSKSYLDSQKADPESSLTPQDISTVTHQTTLRIPNGQAQLAGGMADRKSEKQSRVHLLIVAAEKL